MGTSGGSDGTFSLCVTSIPWAHLSITYSTSAVALVCNRTLGVTRRLRTHFTIITSRYSSFISYTPYTMSLRHCHSTFRPRA